MANSLACRELGKTYAQNALELMMKELGGAQVELSDLEAFYASAVSWLGASGFCLVLEKAGPDEAARFLSLITAGIPACIRLKDAPFMVALSAEIRAVEEEPVDGAAPNTPRDPSRCDCHLGSAGDCPTCPKALGTEYRGFIAYLISYLEEMQKRTTAIQGFCAPCGAKYADRVISEIVKEGISSGPEQEQVKQQAVAIALQTVQAFGVSEAPLTVGALQDRQKA